MSRTSARMRWEEVPAAIRTAVEDVLGSPVVSARTQPGGFSPGSADRVVTADGRRAFVKTAWDAVNAHAPGIHRSEADKARALPAGIPVPRLLGAVDLGGWVAVVYEDVEGRHPATPWRDDELWAALDAFAAIADGPSPPAEAFPPLGAELAYLLGGWRRIAEDRPELGLPAALRAWVEPRLPALAEAGERATKDVAGDRLVHVDARADNILIRPDGSVVIVDWPWAARGARWFDALSLLINVRLFDPAHDVEAVIGRHPVFEGMPPGAATRTLAGLAGFFLDAARQPAVPGIPTLRAFQRDQGIATLAWVRERTATAPGASLRVGDVG